MDIEQLYRDYNVPFVTEGHKHTRPGWVNTACPFCTGNPGYHLGYDTIGNKFVCWRCGGKFANQVISKLLSISNSDANILLRQYGVLISKVPEIKRKIRHKSFKLPTHTELLEHHRNYLIGRKFDPDQIIKDYKIMSTGVMAKLDNINYKHRILIPFFWDNKMVSFDSRDVTDKAVNKYMACPEERELIGHKDILYGQQSKWKDVGICVEGPTDVWRFGANSFAVSGIKYKHSQLRLMAKLFKRIAVVFDDDPQAIIQATKLVADLKFRNVDAFRVGIIGDPGSMSQIEADYLVKQLIKI